MKTLHERIYFSLKNRCNGQMRDLNQNRDSGPLAIEVLFSLMSQHGLKKYLEEIESSESTIVRI